ncbi:MAG: glycosyltransferase, partial [Candidatus Acidiferrales bacterium]
VYMLPRERRYFADPPGHPRMQVEYVPLGHSSPGRLLWLCRELPRRLKETRTDILFSLANIGTLRPIVPQVVYIHQPLAFPRRGASKQGFLGATRFNFMRALMVRGALESRSAIVQTYDMRSRLEDSEPRLCGRISVVPGCVSEVDSGEHVRPEKQKMIDHLTGPRLLYVAYPAKHKNHPALVRAMPALIRQFPTATLLVTLDNQRAYSAADHKYIAELQRLIGELGVGDRIAWLGILNQAEIRYALRQCTLAVFPSLDESFGLPLAEALVERCALAASDLAYARDVAGTAAVYFDPLDPNSIASTLIDLITRPELIERLKREAARRSPRFHPTTVVEQIATLLEAATKESTYSQATWQSAPGVQDVS